MRESGPNGERRRGDVVQRAVQVARIATGEAAEELPEPRSRKGGVSRRGLSRPGAPLGDSAWRREGAVG